MPAIQRVTGPVGAGFTQMREQVRGLFLHCTNVPPDFLPRLLQIHQLMTQLAKTEEEKQIHKAEADALREQVGCSITKAIVINPHTLALSLAVAICPARRRCDV